MRKFARRRLGLASLAIVSSLAIPVATASAHEYDFKGESTGTGCNAKVPVRFKLFVENGKLDHVKNFEARGFNYPNHTPPVPVGKPTGDCIKGRNFWALFGDSRRSTYTTYSLNFGEGPLSFDEFAGVDKYPQ